MSRRSQIEFWCTLLWFSMDALWLVGQPFLAMALAPLTFLLAFALIVLCENAAERWVEVSMFFWIVMSTGWVSSEALKSEQLLTLSRFAVALGIGSLIMARVQSENGWLSIMERFRRLRIRSGSKK